MDSQFSEFPNFSTQESVENVDDVSQNSSKRVRGPSFTIDEDRLLISAWLNIGMDPIQGNEQKCNTFWERITEYYHEYKVFDTHRSQLMLKQRWCKIQKYVNKFSGCFATIIERHESGKTEQDKIGEAKKLFEAQEKFRFNLDHAWILLRHQPKWLQLEQELGDKTSKKRSKISATNSLSSSTTGTHIDIEEDMNTYNPVIRPPGRKAEKRKLRETNDQLVQIQNLHEQKRERDERKLQILKEKIEIDKEKLQVRKIEAENKKIEAEMRILSLDTSTMNQEEMIYYSKLRMKILQGDNYGSC